MHEILVVIDILSAVGIIGLVLLQQGKGADMGAAFGSGASSTLFGARGSANFLTRTTAVLAIVFFASNLGLAYLAGKSVAPKSITETVQEAPKPAAPAVPAVPEQQTPKAPEVPK
ncbi:MAG: preprotein translocase subunit SecG [Acidithiobacillales bacterium SM1_46]|nr:MAG: preprotein translocase subunit SecG [Acidithiobacillales bacterium SM1_46]